MDKDIYKIPKLYIFFFSCHPLPMGSSFFRLRLGEEYNANSYSKSDLLKLSYDK